MLRLAIGAALALGAVVALVANWEVVPRIVNLVPGLVSCAGGKCIAELSPWFAFLVFAQTGFLLILGAYLVFEALFRPDLATKTEVKRLNSYKDKLAAKFSLVLSKIYDLDQPRFNIVEIEEHYEISNHGDVRAELTYEICAGQKPAHFWRHKMNADDYAKEIERLDETKFHVESLNGGEVETIPTRDGPRNKEVGIFFLPELSPGKSKRLKVTFSWPGYFADLWRKDRSVFVWCFRSENTQDVAKVRLCLKFAKEIKQPIVRPLFRCSQESMSWNSTDAWNIFQYECPQLLIGGPTGKPYEFELFY